MKRLFFLVVTTLFAIFIFVKSPVVNAQETVIQTDTPIGTEIPATPSSMIMPQNVEYELPYPGMLPDNPLYFLKVIRDGIVKFLINNSIKRAQFSLLNSDKRMYAGKMLVDKREYKLAVETIAKSNNYMDDAIVAIRDEMQHNKKNTDIRLFLLKLKIATQKHIEVMGNIKKSVDKKVLQQLTIEEKRLKTTQKIVDNLLAQK